MAGELKFEENLCFSLKNLDDSVKMKETKNRANYNLPLMAGKMVQDAAGNCSQ